MAGETLTAQAYAKVSNLEKGTCNFRLILYVGGNPVATNIFAVTTNMVSGQSLDWTAFKVQYTATAGDVGKTIGIAVGSDGGNSPDGYSPSYCYLDDVSLDALLGVGITVGLNNPAFESPTVGAWSSGFFPDDWSIDYGSFMQGPTSHGGGSQCVVNLAQHGWFNLSQQTTNTVQMAGEVLTAQAYARVSNLERGTCDFNLILYIGGNPVVTNTFVVTTNMVSGQSLDWTPFTVQYVASAADVGQTIGIGVGSDGGESPDGYSPSYCYLDDVTLSALLIGAPTVSAVTSSPNPLDLYSNAVLTAVVVPGPGALASVVADASPLGGSSALVLVYSNSVDGARVYTNTVTASAPVDYDAPLTVRVLATDANGLTGEGSTKVTVNRPAIVTWGGGTGNWGDTNWLPYNVTGPITGANRTAIVTNGEVTVDHSGGVGGVAQIVLAQSGTMLVANGHYGAYGNILFAGGTLDTADDSSYHSYGSSILTAVTASGSSSSKIADTAAGTGGGAGWFNLAYPSTTFTVSNGATLTVSAMLAGANNPANDNLYIPSALVKAGGGTLAWISTEDHSPKEALTLVPAPGGFRPRLA